MQYEWLDAYLLAMPGVEKDFKEEWQAWRYLLGGKMFVMHGGDKEGKPIFTMKLEPALSDLLRREYPEIVPGYYMNKVHWSSLYVGGAVPDDMVRQMADNAYASIFQSLTKKAQREIEALRQQP